MMLCDFCERPYRNGLMCERCCKSWDAWKRKDDGTLHSMMVWAAKRARYFERLKHRSKSRPHL